MDVKSNAFEYFVNKLILWQNGQYSDDNDIGILKALKLLFLASTINATKNSTESLLDGVFDNFYAMPFGHVESDVYNAIKSKNGFTNLSITNLKSIISNQNIDIDKVISNKIDLAIEKLKEKNNNLINLTSFELVEISHKWYSWKYFFNKARNSNTYSISIPTSFIKEEEKYYSL